MVFILLVPWHFTKERLLILHNPSQKLRTAPSVINVEIPSWMHYSVHSGKTQYVCMRVRHVHWACCS